MHAVLLRDELAEKRWPVTAKVVHRVYFSAICRESVQTEASTILELLSLRLIGDLSW
jgi:hypothetical protein